MLLCENNLKQIALAERIWAGDHNGKFPMDVSVTNGGAMELAATGNVAAVFQVMSSELTTPKLLVCPADENRFVATNFKVNFNAKNISYFVGLDAKTDLPSTLLFGDDNLDVESHPVKSGLIELTPDSMVTWTTNRHENGNVVFADGNVEPVGSMVFRQLLEKTGITTNHLIIP